MCGLVFDITEVIGFGNERSFGGLGFWHDPGREPLRSTLTDAVGRILDPPVTVLKAWHSGVAADYVAWLTVGTALLGGIWALTLR